MEGLRFKTWRCVPGEWFEGCYVFADDAARAAFQETFTAGAAESPGSQIIGSPPILIEPCSIVAVAEGGVRLRGRAASWSDGYSDSGVHSFFASSSPSPTGSSTGHQVVVGADLADQLADRQRLVVADRRVGDPVVPQRVVEGHDAAGAEQPQRLPEVGGVLGLVAVHEDDVVVAVGEPGEHVERGAGDGAGALGRDAGLVERLAGQPLVLGLDVDGGQHAVGAHPAQQPEPRDPGAGADLDHRAGVEDRGEEAQRGPAAGADRDDADLLGALAGAGEDVVLGDEGLGVGPALRY